MLLALNKTVDYIEYRFRNKASQSTPYFVLRDSLDQQWQHQHVIVLQTLAIYTGQSNLCKPA